MTETLAIGLSSWIIKDGNYDDFKLGQVRSFALEFYASEPLSAKLNTASKLVPHLVWLSDTTYEALGETVFVGDDWWVLDFGLPAYSSRAKERSAPGTYYQGKIYMGVDHFDYFERLSRENNAPPLIYDWRVERIEIQTAPLILKDARTYIRDPEKLGWRDITHSDAWKDDGGHAEYILHCTRLSEIPRHRLVK